MAIPVSETRREDAKTNPFGSNQYLLDPRQKLMWEYYINPKSETFGNAYQSALKANYEEATATQITTYDWFLDKRRRLNLLSKAEKVLEECLEMPIEVLDWEGHGEDRTQIVKTEPSLIKIKQDTAKFIASTQGKDEGYSTRTENTGKDGGPQEHVVVNTENDELVKEFEAKLRARIIK